MSTAEETAGSALAAYLAHLRSQVDASERLVGRLQEIDAGLHGRVRQRLADLASDASAALDAAEAAGSGRDEVRAAKQAVALLARESLAFTEGALTRREELDDGFCALADKLLDHLAELQPKLEWQGFTILAETAFLGDVAEVVRLRFPETSLWHLPVAVHEFGHYANPRIELEVRRGSFWRSEYPVGDELAARRERKEDGLEAWFHAHELLADAFAVYSVGPAYAYSALLLGPDPGTLLASDLTHPSWSERFLGIAEMLRRVQAHGGATRPIVQDFEERLDEIRGAVGDDAQTDGARVGELLDFFQPHLERGFSGLRYTTFARAQQLSSAFEADGPLPPLGDATMPDVVNAAWLARLDHLHDETRVERIEARATEALSSL